MTGEEETSSMGNGAKLPISSAGPNSAVETLLASGMMSPPHRPGTLGRIDRFEIIRILGEGGMGQVFLARDPATTVPVAVKMLKPGMESDPRAVHRFLVEAWHMSRLSHENILRVTEIAERKDGPYYVMPYVEGGSLVSRCRPAEPVPDEQILSVAVQVAGALAYAHSRGIIHRDLKPDNTRRLVEAKFSGQSVRIWYVRKLD